MDIDDSQSETTTYPSETSSSPTSSDRYAVSFPPQSNGIEEHGKDDEVSTNLENSRYSDIILLYKD